MSASTEKILLLLLPSHAFGGAEQVAVWIARAASAQGWTVHAALTPEDAPEALKQALAGIAALHTLEFVRVDPCNAIRPGQLLRLLFATAAARRLIKRIRPDCIQLHIPFYCHDAVNALIACALLRIPTAVLFHSFPSVLEVPKAFRSTWSWARSRCQRWITTSEDSRRNLSKSFAVAPDGVSRIYNGVPIPSEWLAASNEMQSAAQGELRLELAFEQDSILLLAVGRLDHLKGFDVLLRATAMLRARFPNIVLLIAGEGPERGSLERLIEKLDLGGRVYLLGQRDDVSRLMNAADLFVFPSFCEGLSLTLVEAMAHGMKIVCANTSSVPELITHEVSGVLCPPRDAEALSDAVTWALEHDDCMSSMATEARTAALQFDVELMRAEHLQQLEELRPV